ncbi:MAG: ATPase [Planctomycetes bacterium]|nr:ATPase [Planctomycetota bacterium]
MRVRRWVMTALLVNLVAAGAIVVVDEAVAAEAAAEAVGETIQEVGAPPKNIYDVYETMALAASVSFVTAVSIVGAAYAVGRVGSAAIGAAAEKPELLTRSLLFVALAEGLAVLGFAVAMMLLQKM